MSQIGVLSTGRRRQASRKRCDIEVAMYHGIGLGGRPARDVSRGQDRRATCWSSRTAWPPFQTRTVPLDWDTEIATALVSTVIAAAAAWRAPRPSGSSTLPSPTWRERPAGRTTPFSRFTERPASTAKFLMASRLGGLGNILSASDKTLEGVTVMRSVGLSPVVGLS